MANEVGLVDGIGQEWPVNHLVILFVLLVLFFSVLRLLLLPCSSCFKLLLHLGLFELLWSAVLDHFISSFLLFILFWFWLVIIIDFDFLSAEHTIEAGGRLVFIR